MMKTKIFLLFFLVVGLASSCKKDKYDAEKQAAIDETIIKDFIAKNSLVATPHSSGIYYQILNAGNGNLTYTGATQVTVKYEGRLLNGSMFDGSISPVTFTLGRLVQGWQIGIPLIQKGGKIRLIIPSTLAYKNQSPTPAIPENSVLDFTIELVNAQ
ncbi:putative FKBP-type peptidyl-prolyl cis-trans isomerase FkpA [compost metagenome]